MPYKALYNHCTNLIKAWQKPYKSLTKALLNHMRPYQGHIKVSLNSNPYEIVIGNNSLDCIGEELSKIGFREGLKILVVSNKEVSDNYGNCVIESLIRSQFNPKLLILKAGDENIPVICRLDTQVEIEYYKNGGILHTVLRKFMRENKHNLKN